jgi:hypothetical protein
VSDVWLGDVIQAWHALGADGEAGPEASREQARQVAALLGFSLPAARAAPARAPSAPGPIVSPATRQDTERVPSSRPSAPAPSVVRRGPAEPARPVTFRRNLRPAGVDVGVRTPPGADVPGSVDVLQAEPARRTKPLPLLPLLPARVTPGILTGAVATDAGDGPPDVDALVELVARRRFSEAVPRIVRASLFRGVQLLLDRSPAMSPFARDVTELAQLARLVVGHDVKAISFADHPLDRLPRDGTRYAPPRPGTPVLALSDLGIGQPPGHLRADARDSWPPLAEMLRRRGSELVVFVPYPRSRWPVLPGVRMIPWDTTTSPADVTRAVGRILGGPRVRS